MVAEVSTREEAKAGAEGRPELEFCPDLLLLALKEEGSHEPRNAGNSLPTASKETGPHPITAARN